MNSLNEMKSKIINCFSNTDFSDESHVDDLILTFKGQHQADYYYVIIVSKYVDFIHIGANLINQPPYQYFWHIDYNFIDNANLNERNLHNIIIENLRILVNYQTRIIQKKGLFRHTFTLEYLKDNKWIEYYKNNGSRFSDLKFPEIGKSKKVYT